MLFTTRFSLGIPELLPQWQHMLSKRYMLNDILSGITVACVAVPLALAIALASGVEPAIGLITAIIAGIVCALFGGVTLAVSGPAAAMAVLVSAVVQDFGLTGLLFVGFGCGLLQLLTGIFGFGTLVRFVPVPVVMGFTAGIGAIILIGQFPRILGLPAPSESNVASVLIHIKDLFHQTQPTALALSLTTLGITLALPRIWPRLPSPLFAVAIPSLIVYFLHIPVEVIGAIPSTLPLPKLPEISATLSWIELSVATLVVFALASLESLLSAGAIDQLSKSKPHDPNQELIGQGIGNICVAFFGGIPITSVIARSALNVQSGAKTRRAAIFHALVLLAVVYYFAPIVSHIPIAVLAGLLISIALRMCHPHEFLMLWHSSRTDALVYLITFVMIIVLGLLKGIEVGIIAALILAAIRLNQAKITLRTNDTNPAQLEFEGCLTFLSSTKVDTLQKKLESIDLPFGIIFDLVNVKMIDASGASHLMNLVEQLQHRKIKVALYGIDGEHSKMLTAVKQEAQDLIAYNEAHMEKILGIKLKPEQIHDRLAHGIQQFKRNLHPRHKAFFSGLAKIQTPHTLFITCSDSRIDPNLITSTQPGELFIVRNVGNIIPTFGNDQTPAEGAAIEYALNVLKVERIIVCAHSECGAMQQLVSGDIFKPENTKALPSVAKWLSIVEEMRTHFSHNVTNEEAAKLNAAFQIENIKTYPVVQERLANQSLKLQAWFYNIGEAELENWDEVLNKYTVIGESDDHLMFGANGVRGLFVR